MLFILSGMPPLPQALILVVGAQFKYTPSDASSTKFLMTGVPIRLQEGRDPTRSYTSAHPTASGPWEMSCPRVPKVWSWQEEIFYTMLSTTVRPWEGNMNSNLFSIFFDQKLFVSTPPYSIMGKSRIPFQISTNPSTDLFYTRDSGVLHRQTSTDIHCSSVPHILHNLKNKWKASVRRTERNYFY